MPRIEINVEKVEVLSIKGVADTVRFYLSGYEYPYPLVSDSPAVFELRLTHGTAKEYLMKNFGLEPDNVIAW